MNVFLIFFLSWTDISSMLRTALGHRRHPDPVCVSLKNTAHLVERMPVGIRIECGGVKRPLFQVTPIPSDGNLIRIFNLDGLVLRGWNKDTGPNLPPIHFEKGSFGSVCSERPVCGRPGLPGFAATSAENNR
jgi:hypothetical protein